MRKGVTSCASYYRCRTSLYRLCTFEYDSPYQTCSHLLLKAMNPLLGFPLLLCGGICQKSGSTAMVSIAMHMHNHTAYSASCLDTGRPKLFHLLSIVAFETRDKRRNFSLKEFGELFRFPDGWGIRLRSLGL